MRMSLLGDLDKIDNLVGESIVLGKNEFDCVACRLPVFYKICRTNQ